MDKLSDLPLTLIRTPRGDELVVLTRAAYDELVALSHGRLSRGRTRPIAGQPDADSQDRAIANNRRKAWLEAGKPTVPLSVVRRVRAGDSYLRAFRAERGLTQEQLAKRAGIAQGYLSEIETSRRAPNAEIRAKLAAALDIHAIFLSDDAAAKT